ncbi:uncharacterized protein LOC117167018 [Belonocnema kinseyi]|uniref:uncharacterized protein LOC117167018 n=1 Tax=Belonocnema kinseyi TaxID=2817044 RepID=UPI00143CD366|nr:uncharacterized protein LOC117167018 [Belonocnema kinseyi]
MNRRRSQLHFFIFWSLLCLSRQARVKNISSAVARQIRSIGFPEGSGMGIFFAIAIPIDIPDKSISVSNYFEANYGLPGDKNSSYFEEYYQKRSIDRRFAYNILENKLKSAGYPARTCLLRTICEAAEIPLIENGLIGDILQILFTPSASQDENLPMEIKEAEFAKNCADVYSDCPISLLDMIS